MKFFFEWKAVLIYNNVAVCLWVGVVEMGERSMCPWEVGGHLWRTLNELLLAFMETPMLGQARIPTLAVL